ncbi:MAG: hypothetical protein R3181_11560 [Rubricoccaceae bacterium]|nr:hypothetical protein [Rubricoccaceae bacterium]
MRIHPRSRPVLYAFAAVLLIGLAACAEETEVEPVAEPVPMEEPAPMPEPAAPAPGTVDVAGTISALQGGITALPMNAAIDNINGWIAQLEGADFDGSDEMVEELTELRDELQASPIDGAEVAESLTELGRMTSEVGADVGNADLEQLGNLLSTAGNQLSGM